MTTTSSRPPFGTGSADQLAAHAAQAARIRALSTGPDVIALRVERIRGQVDTGAWLAIGLGLAFTAVNVQVFAAAGAPAWSPGWAVPQRHSQMVSLLLVAILRAEQVTARWQVDTGPVVRAEKWGCFAATYAMNVWAAWELGVASGVVLHSVPPLVVLGGAEVAPILRDRLTEAAHRAADSTPTARPTPATPTLAARTGRAPTAALAGPGPDLPAPVAPTTGAGQDRAAALAIPLTAGSRPGHHDHVTGFDLAAEPDEGSDGRDEGEDCADDARVREVAGLITGGGRVTGAQVGALHGLSERHGRRQLRGARQLLDAPDPPEASASAAAAGPRGRLHVVPAAPETTPPSGTTTATETGRASR